ncbi:MAG: SAM-dependent methyltransferase [Planctomycetota bacterium]|nr:MAG: SAM-dependent methyltransferase [Planctomycetota bacterium]
MRLIKEFIKHPSKTGSISPSSSFLSLKMLEPYTANENRGFIVELGPGTGAITKYILEEINDIKDFLTIEINTNMVKHLIKKYPELDIAPISAEYLHEYLTEKKLPKPSHIISGLPWAVFKDELQDKILESVSTSLEENGCFTTFAYLHALKLKSAIKFREKLNKTFSKVETTSPIWRNIPPAIVYHCHL